MSQMVIAGTNVGRDAEGRYSLNDLHRAAGGEDKHRPGQFTRTDTFKALVVELEGVRESAHAPVATVNDGRNNGTYVAEQLVVAYAAWISAKFHLEVINTFLAAKKAVVRKAAEAGIAGPVAREYRDLLSIAKLSGLKGNPAIIAAAQGTEKLVGQNPLAMIGQTHLLAVEQVRHCTPTELGKEVGESGQAFNKRLAAAGLQVKSSLGHWEPTKAGQAFAVLMDTGKRHSDGTPVQQLKWLESVLNYLTDPRAA